MVDFDLIENRLDKFPKTEFKEVKEETSEIVELRSRAVNQTVDRLRMKGVLPQSNYNSFQTFPTEFSAIFNMSEYSDSGDMLYKFDLRVINTTGTIFRVWTVIATNNELDFYGLIDYGCIEKRFDEFKDVMWKEIYQDEDHPLPDVLVQMRGKSAFQATKKLIDQGILPQGHSIMASTTSAERTVSFIHPEFHPGDVLNRFNVQVMDEAGVRSRVVTIEATSEKINPSYELTDYFFIENSLDDFNNVSFGPLNEDAILGKSIRQAVDRLQGEGTLPEGEFKISKTFPTEISANFEHPQYSNHDYILYKFTAQVKNCSGAEFKVYAIVLAAYYGPEYFGLIDCGILNS